MYGNGEPFSFKEIVFYTNEDEFCTNFQKHMTDPPAVTSMMDLIELKYSKVTPDILNLQVYVQVAEFIELKEEFQ